MIGDKERYIAPPKEAFTVTEYQSTYAQLQALVADLDKPPEQVPRRSIPKIIQLLRVLCITAGDLNSFSSSSIDVNMQIEISRLQDEMHEARYNRDWNLASQIDVEIRELMREAKYIRVNQFWEIYAETNQMICSISAFIDDVTRVTFRPVNPSQPTYQCIVIDGKLSVTKDDVVQDIDGSDKRTTTRALIKGIKELLPHVKPPQALPIYVQAKGLPENLDPLRKTKF